MTSPTPGGSYTYTGDQRGERADVALLPGTVCTVRELVSAETSGAHTADEDAVVIEWEIQGQVVTDYLLESYQAPVVQLDDAGFPKINDEGVTVVLLEPRQRAVPIFGTGPIQRAMSLSLADFSAEFTEV